MDLSLCSRAGLEGGCVVEAEGCPLWWGAALGTDSVTQAVGQYHEYRAPVTTLRHNE